MKKELNRIDKFYVVYRGKIDADVSAIKCSSTENCDDNVLISPYIMDELAKLVCDSKKIFLKKQWTYFFNRKGRKRYRYTSFNNALIQIDKCINDLKSYMRKDESDFDSEKEKLNYLLNESKKNNAIHFERMYEMKIMDLNSNIKSIEDRTYSNIEIMLNEKIRLLKKALIYQGYLESCCTYRLQYYYDSVCQNNKKYVMTIININDYSNMFNTGFSEWYEEQIRLTQQTIEDYKNRKI